MNETLIAPKAETSTGQKSLIQNPTIAPQRAPAIEAPENPDVIELTISEVDRQTAGEFSEPWNCLICTSLKNNGFNADVGVSCATVNGVNYSFERAMTCPELYVKHFNLFGRSPHYGRRVVGKVIRLHKMR